MKKKLLALACAAALALSGCAVGVGETQPPEGGYEVYYVVTGAEKSAARAVDFEYRVPSPEDDPAEALVGFLLSAPQTLGLASPAPGVRLRSAELGEDGQLRLDLSEQYGGLSGIDLTVANACFTLTLCQLAGVSSVYITVEGDPIPYQSIHDLHAGDIILPGAEEEAVTVKAALYFPRTDGIGLGVEYRDVVKTEDDTLAAAILTALLAGPQFQSMRSLMPEGVELRGVKVEDGTCYVDFSSAFVEGAPQSREEQRLLLYSVVNTMCAQEALTVNAVQLLVEGQTVGQYGGVPAAAALEPDFSLSQS